MKLIVMKKGGEPGEIAINPERVTYVRTASGPFTDIYFGDHRVTVEGTFQQVVARLTGAAERQEQTAPAIKSWLPVR